MKLTEDWCMKMAEKERLAGDPEIGAGALNSVNCPAHGTEAQIKHMVDRFLQWKLPSDFNPDGGISFKKTFNDHLPTPSKNEPVGTNLLDASQADAMVRFMIEGLPR